MRALRALLRLGRRTAALVRIRADGTRTEQQVPVEQVAVGDLVLVRPGGTVPTDGVVVEGTSAVDTSLVTGEPVPVEVGPGDAVVGGTLNTAGLLLVRAVRVGADTTLARIGRLVTQAQNGKAPVQRLADRVSAVFVPVVLALALAHRGRPGSSPPATSAPRLHRRRRRPRHRLPLRARARDPDGAPRGHRAGRTARHPRPEPADPRERPPCRRRPARQDRHGHRGRG